MAENMKGSTGGTALPVGRIALILAALIALVTVAIAILKGRDSAESEPAIAAVPQPATQDVPAMIAKLETKLKGEPNDPDGWNMLGWSYFETGRYADSAKAYRRAADLSPKTAGYWSALGEALVLSGPGGVTPAAGQAFATALANDPKDHRARYFIGVKKDLAGDHEGAVDDWIALLKDSPAGAPWEQPVRELLEKVATANKIDIAGRLPAPSVSAATDPEAVAAAGIPGPSREQMQAASQLPPGQQDAMVKGMVDSLAAKLRANPRDGDGWIRLMRARMVLGDTAGATSALRDGQAAFAGDAGERARLVAAAKTLSVPGV